MWVCNLFMCCYYLLTRTSLVFFRFAKDGSVINFKSTSLVLSSLGAFILAFTWISFNGSSVLVTKDSSVELSAFAVLNTFLCLTTAGVSSVLIETVAHKGTYDLPYTINGMLGGLVAVTASCAFIDNWCAILLGICSAAVSKGSSWLLLNKVRRGGGASVRGWKLWWW